MNETLQFILVFSIGATLGAWWSWHLWLKRERPIVNATLVITPQVLTQLNGQMVGAWLESHGMTWMPKGAAFDPHRETRH